MAVEDLSLTFGEKTLFSNLNFTINKGDKIALLGRNGVGKSSLLKVLLGEQEPTSGKVQKLDSLDVGYFSQKREALKDNETPWTMIGEGIDYVISNTGDKRHVASYLENFLFSSDEIKRPIHTFSGGEKNRLQLAQFMKHARDIWIFDEPTNDLDLETIGILEEELRNYGGALIIVGHDRSFIDNVTDKCWVLHDGKIETFEAGFSQAEIYLEALALEEELKKKSSHTSTAAPVVAPQVQAQDKLTNKERNRLNSIQADIDKAEAKVAKITQEMSSAGAARLVELQADLTKAEAKLEELINEWGDLESRA